MDPAGYLVDCDDGRLEDGNSAAANEDQRVRRAEIDRELATPLETPLCHRPVAQRYRGWPTAAGSGEQWPPIPTLWHESAIHPGGGFVAHSP
jgi:hypothetical protein